MADEKSVLVRLKEFFEMKTTDFMREWSKLSEQDKVDLRKGAEDGSWTY